MLSLGFGFHCSTMGMNGIRASQNNKNCHIQHNGSHKELGGLLRIVRRPHYKDFSLEPVCAEERKHHGFQNPFVCVLLGAAAEFSGTAFEQNDKCICSQTDSNVVVMAFTEQCDAARGDFNLTECFMLWYHKE